MKSHPYLRRLYRKYNKKYFNNQLPDIPVAFASPGTFHRAGLGKKTCAVTLFEPDYRPKAIIIRHYPSKNWCYIKSDLLHELVHVAHPRWNHGRNFKAEIRRLAAEGAFDDIL